MIEHDQAKICIATMGGALAPPIDIKTIFDSELQTDLFDHEGEAVVMLLLVAYKGCVATLFYDCLTLF